MRNAIILASVLLAGSLAHATVIHIPDHYTSIQAGIDAASPGDTVEVAPGTYYESLDYQGKAIVVRSTEGPRSTIITHSPSVDLVVFDEGEPSDAVLEGFTLDGGHIAVWCQSAAPTIRRCLIINQTVDNWAAVVLSGIGWAKWGPAPATLENLTIAHSANGGISTFSTEAPTIKNTIVIDCKYGVHHQGSGGSVEPILSYNNMWGTWLSNYYNCPDTGTGTISANPQFTVDFLLLPGSPCIDAGDPDPLYNDPDGSRSDMGALPFDESVGPGGDGPVRHVPGEYPTIQLAILAAETGDTVLVAPGEYDGPINFLGKAIVVRSSEGPLQTTITGPDASDLVVFAHGETATSILEGFRLLGGWRAIWCQDAGPTIRRNIMTDQHVDNWAAISLGGMGYGTTGNSPALIVNNTIVGCRNGAISTFSLEAPVIKNNIIAHNGHYGIHKEGIKPGVAHPDLSYNDVFGNPVAYYEITDSGIGTIYVDPLLSSAHTLLPGSPCIDAGDPDAIYNDPDGSRNDMGAVPSDGGAEPPAHGDTVFIEYAMAGRGDTVKVRVGLANHETVAAGLTIPLKIEGTGVQLTDVQHVDLAGEFDIVTDLVDASAQTVLLGYVDLGDGLAPARGILAELTFAVAVDAPDQTVIIDTTYLPPANHLTLVSPQAEASTPAFVPGRIFIGACPLTTTGDANGDGMVNAADAVYTAGYLFRSGPEPRPLEAVCDVNCDTVVTAADIIKLVSYIFKSGTPPCDACSTL